MWIYKMAKPYPKSKQTAKTIIKASQRKMGNISKLVREQVFGRSNGVCELCNSQRALQMAHIIGRKQINHVTTAEDLLHVCVACHKWMDETTEGIRWKKNISNSNNSNNIV